MGKTRGMGAGRKLKNHRRAQKWADKSYKKSHQGNEWKKPFAGSSHAKGIVLEKIGIEAKQPNSAIRKCARVQLIKNGKKIAAFVPRDGCLNYIEENVSTSLQSICLVQRFKYCVLYIDMTGIGFLLHRSPSLSLVCAQWVSITCLLDFEWQLLAITSNVSF
jgi:small subunit ribosomal protein S23e